VKSASGGRVYKLRTERKQTSVSTTFSPDTEQEHAPEPPLRAALNGHDFARIEVIGIQPKLEVSEPGDPLEEEADLQADRVLGMTDSQIRAPSATTSATTALAPKSDLDQKQERQHFDCEKVRRCQHRFVGGPIEQRRGCFETMDGEPMNNVAAC
jgi:hypothetical protein